MANEVEYLMTRTTSDDIEQSLCVLSCTIYATFGAWHEKL